MGLRCFEGEQPQDFVGACCTSLIAQHALVQILGATNLEAQVRKYVSGCNFASLDEGMRWAIDLREAVYFPVVAVSRVQSPVCNVERNLELGTQGRNEPQGSGARDPAEAQRGIWGERVGTSPEGLCCEARRAAQDGARAGCEGRYRGCGGSAGEASQGGPTT